MVFNGLLADKKHTVSFFYTVGSWTGFDTSIHTGHVTHRPVQRDPGRKNHWRLDVL